METEDEELHYMNAKVIQFEDDMDAQSAIVMPSCKPQEQGLVANLMQYPLDTIQLMVKKGVNAESFYFFEHKTLVAEVLRRYNSGESVDWRSVSHACHPTVSLSVTTGFAIQEAIPGASGYWLDDIREFSDRRSIIRSSHKAIELANVDGSASAIASIAHDVSILGPQEGSEDHSIRSILKATISKIAGENVKEPIKTGWSDLDRLCHVRRGDTIVIAAPMKGGKSTLALSYMAEVAKRGLPCVLFSLEMAATDIGEKLLARQARVPMDRLFTREFVTSDTDRLAMANDELSKWKLYIHNNHDLASIMSIARSAKAKHPDLAMVVIDYLQLVQGPASDTREREVAEVSRSLRRLAMELDCVVVALSQLNDEGKLRESRAIGQDATAVWLVEKTEDDDTVYTVKVAVQRNGQSGVKCELQFLGQFAHFGGMPTHAAR
jgi:replicative DNA helicase